MPISSVTSATKVEADNTKIEEHDSDEFMNRNDSSYDDYDDFPIASGGNVSSGGAINQRQIYQKRNKTDQQQIYSSKHTRLRENRVSSAKTASPKR